MTKRELDELASQQYGLIGRKQALDVLTKRQIGVRTGSGEWTVVRPGIYRLRSAPLTWEARVLACILEREAVASHRCAAALWGIGGRRWVAPEFTVPYLRRPRREAGLHVSTQWARRDEQVRRGIACTGIDRTILDCAAVTNWRHVELLAESAIRQRLTSWQRLRSTLIVHSRRGRNGCGTLRHMLDDRAGTPGVTRSDFSLLVLGVLRRHGIPEPVTEYPVSDEKGQHILSLDLAWPDQKKAWELDGLEWHFGRTDVERDRRKRNQLVNQGWVIQEILWSMYTDAPEDLAAMARRFLQL